MYQSVPKIYTLEGHYHVKVTRNILSSLVFLIIVLGNGDGFLQGIKQYGRV